MRASLLVAFAVTATFGTADAAAPVERAADAMSGACALITRDEAARALGAPVPLGTEQAMSFPVRGRVIPAEYCLYGAEVIVARFDMGPDAETAFQEYRKSLAALDDYQNVSGVGDAAFAAKGQLAVRRGQTGLIIDVGQARGGGDAELAAERALAMLALGRL